MVATGDTRVLTVPNVISAARIASVPGFGWLLLTRLDVAALVLLFLAGVSDLADGWLARRLHQVTRLGRLLDPVADRAYVVVAVLALAVRGSVPWLLVAVLVLRDVVLGVNLLVLRHHGVAPLPVHLVGKAATFTLFAGFPTVILADAAGAARPWALPLGWALVLWGAALYWWAAAGYLVQARQVLGEASPGPGAGAVAAGTKA